MPTVKNLLFKIRFKVAPVDIFSTMKAFSCVLTFVRVKEILIRSTMFKAALLCRCTCCDTVNGYRIKQVILAGHDLVTTKIYLKLH